MHCFELSFGHRVLVMEGYTITTLRFFSILCSLILCGYVPGYAAAEPSPAANVAFNLYVEAVRSRLAHQHSSRTQFLVPSHQDQQGETSLRRREFLIENLTPTDAITGSGAMLHHWRGTAFVAGAKASDFERLLRNFNAYPQRFFPQITGVRVLSEKGDHFEITMRVRQRHVITVVMETAYDIDFGRFDTQRGYCASRSTRISEIEAAGTSAERALDSRHEHGFLWRQNSYWSYEERNGGLYVQIESVSLTRSIPSGLAWAVRPFVESVPRESLEFTLRSIRAALIR